MVRKRRIAIVGVGSIGRRHARLLSQRDDIIVELLEPSEENLALIRNELGEVTVHQNFEQMLRTAPDVVWIATPTPLHAEQSIAALRAGCHVFCEKPMSLTLIEARKMQAAAEREGRILNIGFNLHFHPALVRMKQLIEMGSLGTILHVHARVGSYTTLVNSRSRHQSLQEGSLIFDYAHQPDLFYWLLNEVPTRVFCHGLLGGGLEYSSNPNIASITCFYERPMLATIHLNYVQMPERHEYEVVGDDGWALLDVNEGKLRVGSRSAGEIKVEDFQLNRDDMYRAEHEAYLLAIEGKRGPDTPPAAGLVSTAVCEAAVQSWKTGQTVKILL